jgi:hypothetical protein
VRAHSLASARTEQQCRWCDRPATTVREIAPAVVKTGQVLRAAIRADVCDEHAAMIDREVRRAQLEKQIRGLNARLARTEPGTPCRANVTRKLGDARLELAELEASP